MAMMQLQKFKNENIIVGDQVYPVSADLLKKATVKEVNITFESELGTKFIYKPKDSTGKEIEKKDVAAQISKELEKKYQGYNVRLNYAEDEYGMPRLSLFLKKK